MNVELPGCVSRGIYESNSSGYMQDVHYLIFGLLEDQIPVGNHHFHASILVLGSVCCMMYFEFSIDITILFSSFFWITFMHTLDFAILFG